MTIRMILVISMSVRIGIIMFCCSLVYAQKILSEPQFFNATLSDAQQIEAVKKSFNVDERNNDEMTGLMVAASLGKRQLASELINQGAHVNLTEPSRGATALIFALSNLNNQEGLAIAQMLIDPAYASVAIANKIKSYPIHVVGSYDSAPRNMMLDRLIVNGANINAQDQDGNTLLHLAGHRQDNALIAYILDTWGTLADTNITNKKGQTPYEYTLSLGFGDTAVAFGQEVKRITKATDRDARGLTGLMLAVLKRDAKMLDAMLKEKEALDLVSDDMYGNTALHYALLTEELPLIEKVVASGVSKKIANKKGETPLHYVIRLPAEKQVKVASLLLKDDQDSINSQTEQGENLIHYIARYDAPDLLAYLMKSYKPQVSAALSVKNKALKTPLDVAKAMRRKKIEKSLGSVK